MMYDYIIVGSGLFGSVFAHEMKKRGKKCLVLEKRNHIGGNIYSEKVEGINVHKYGPHIFHTSNDFIWQYVNKLTPFNNFINTPVANYKGELYSLPFNMFTFKKLWGVETPEEAKHKIEEQRIKNENPQNLEELALSQVGKDIYEKLIYGYTCKQWGREPKDLPAFIIKRLPLRFTFNNNYYNDKYQGIPLSGYTNLISKLLDGIEVKLNVDFLKERTYWESISENILYTGKIDELFNYEDGELEYRSLEFEHIYFEDKTDFQGVAIMNFTDKETPYTRVIEHKHFENTEIESTIITKEYPLTGTAKNTPYYPVNDERNNKIYKSYKEKSTLLKNYIFGGRLASYKYLDMDQVVEAALNLVHNQFRNP